MLSSILPHAEKMRKEGVASLRIDIDTEFDADDVYVISIVFDGGPNVVVCPDEWGNKFGKNMQDI